MRLPDLKKKTSGLTMIELLIVIAILAVLLLVLWWYLRGQLEKGRDAKRKGDLREYAVIFEDYFNDKARYPEIDAIDNCNSDELDPYLKTIACDPGPGNIPYDYITDDEGSWYALCADLENETDPAVINGGCAGGCGTGGDYNYCQTVGISTEDLMEGGGGGFQGNFACDPNGICNNYADPQGSGCPASWMESDCQNSCVIPANRCPI